MTTESDQKHTEGKPTEPITPVVMKRTVSFKTAVILGGVALLFIGFLGGLHFERVRMRHFMGWRENYHRNFFGPSSLHGEPAPFGPPSHFRAHSLLGKILAIDNDKLTVQDRDEAEQSVVISDRTFIRRDGSAATRSDLQVDQQIAVFGRPTGEGQIAAHLIRIFENNENPVP